MWGFLGAVIGGLCVLGGGFFANRVLANSENRRWLAEEKLRRRTRTAERLRKLYAPLVQSTVTFQSVAAERLFLMSGDVDEAGRNERHVKELNAALELVTAVGGELLVDKDAKPIRNLYNDFRREFNLYISAWESEYGEGEGAQRARDIEKHRQELSRLALEIQEFAENQLDELNAPPTLRDLG